MSIARSLLLRASRSPWLAEQFRRRAFARRAVRRFMPGEEVEAALGASAEFAREGIGTILTSLGERVTNAREAAAVRDHYLTLLDTIRERSLPAHVSVKLTHLGLGLDREACAQSVLTLAARAGETGSFLWIDMEESEYVDPTLEIYRRARTAHPSVGLAIQAYLRRTPADVDSLLPLHPTIRLVKGAYREPPQVAYPRKQETDAAYLAIGERLLERARRGEALPVFGTHDLRLVREIRRRAEEMKLPSGAYEVHMLYGIQSGEQRALARAGVPVRVLVSYGSQWFPWYMRRLAERPANVWFVVRNLLP